MSNLRERLEKRSNPETVLTIDGERFLVVGLSRSERARQFAKCRDKSGKVNTERIEGEMLCLCVRDPDTREQVFTDWSAWDNLPAQITGPLMAEIMQINGMDKDDVGREVKNSDATSN